MDPSILSDAAYWVCPCLAEAEIVKLDWGRDSNMLSQNKNLVPKPTVFRGHRVDCLACFLRPPTCTLVSRLLFCLFQVSKCILAQLTGRCVVQRGPLELFPSFVIQVLVIRQSCSEPLCIRRFPLFTVSCSIAMCVCMEYAYSAASCRFHSLFCPG